MKSKVIFWISVFSLIFLTGCLPPPGSGYRHGGVYGGSRHDFGRQIYAPPPIFVPPPPRHRDWDRDRDHFRHYNPDYYRR